MANPAMINMGVSLVAMQVARRLPLNEPEYLPYLRLGYVGSQLLAFGLYFILTLIIRKKNDLKVLKYVEPGSAMDPDAKSKLVTTTVKDYDLAEVGKAMRGLFTGIAMMAFLHGYLKYTQPLFIQGLMTLVGVIQSNEFKLQIFGAKPEGALARPFKTGGGGLMDMLSGKSSEVATDAASIKAAEKDKNQ